MRPVRVLGKVLGLLQSHLDKLQQRRGQIDKLSPTLEFR
jgi:hypothetical protein